MPGRTISMTHAPDHPAPQAPAAVPRQYVYVAEIGEGGAVGDHPGQPDLLRAVIKTEADRSREHALHQLEPDPLRPVGGGEIRVDRPRVEAGRVGGKLEAVPAVLLHDRHPARAIRSRARS